MKTATRLGLATLAALATLGLSIPQSHSQAKDDVGILRLLTCQDSWMDWKDDPFMRQKFAEELKANFKQNERDGSFVPIKPMSIMGHPVLQLFPQSVGMGLGYSVIVNASFAATKVRLEKQMGKPFDRCEAASEGKSCERELAKRKTVTVTEVSRGKDPKTLFGCYYFYEK